MRPGLRVLVEFVVGGVVPDGLCFPLGWKLDRSTEFGPTSASLPLRLPKTILTDGYNLQRDLATGLTPGSSTDALLRTLGHAYGLASLVSIVTQRSHYVFFFFSYDVSAIVLDTVTQLLRHAGEHNIKDAGRSSMDSDCFPDVSWTQFFFPASSSPTTGFMCRNALPKPTPKDSALASSIGWPITEWLFLLHKFRKCSLGNLMFPSI